MDEWNGYTIMITNIRKEKLPLDMIMELYRLRWQIELFFKNLKSNLSIDKLSGKNANRILVLIYTKLIIAWLVSFLYSYAQSLIKDRNVEVSFFKFTKWLIEGRLLFDALISNDFSILLKQLKDDIASLCTQKRKRKSSKDIMSDLEEEKWNVA